MTLQWLLGGGWRGVWSKVGLTHTGPGPNRWEPRLRVGHRTLCCLHPPPNSTVELGAVPAGQPRGLQHDKLRCQK